MRVLVLMSVLSFVLTACSESPSGNKSLLNSTNQPPGGGGGGGTPITQTLVDYGGTYSTQPGNIHYKVKTMFNSFGQVDPTNVRVRLTTVPSGFDTSDNVYINFYVMGISSNGTPLYPSTPWRPARVRFENPSTYQAVCPSTGMSSCYFGWDPAANNGQGQNYPINRAAIQNMITRPGGLPSLTSYNIIVTGADQIYQLLRVEVTDANGQVLNADVLIPRYEANPNIYRDSRHPSLHAFHPLWSEVDNGLDSAGYRQRIMSLFTF